MKIQLIVCAVALLVLVPLALTAQVAREHDVAPLRSWQAPLYFQPTQDEAHRTASQPDAAGTLLPQAQSPANSLVFVGMTPCRVIDTRISQGFTGAFGPPSLVGQAAGRAFPLQSSVQCPIPAIAQAYSLNVTAVPAGFLGYLSIWPTGLPQPVVSTLNDSFGQVLANAATVPAGSPNGSVSVYALNDTDLVIDINGYYAPQTGITLAQGSAGAPSLSFSGDAGTGIFSSGAGTLNFATGGTNSMTLASNGDLDLPGSIRKNGTLFLNGLGTRNIGVGISALPSSTGTDNTASGNSALTSNTTGSYNTASGSAALFTNTTGLGNTASGAGALYFNTTATNNTASGSYALYHNTTGAYNTASGTYALSNNVGGTGNTASGSDALWGNTAGNDNTASGYSALYHNTSGSSNIAVGRSSGTNLTTGSNNIMIGNQGVAGDDHIIRIGDVQTKTFLAGIAGVTTGGAAVNVVIDSNGQLGTVSSSRRFKEDMQDMADASAKLMDLRPVTFRYKKPYADGSKPLDYGLIAEEVAEVYPDLVVKGADGQVETVQYQKLTPMLLNELQKQHSELQEQREQNRNQSEQLQLLQAQVSALQKTVEAVLLSSKSSSTAARGQ